MRKVPRNDGTNCKTINNNQTLDPGLQSGVKTDLAALQRLRRVGRGDGGVELVLWFAQQGDHFTVGVVAVLHHLVRLHGLVQDVAEVTSL